ncbi:MAG: hypothetical protein QME81_15525 [bacterium]|nr:hypothetical protein [bacterium]
MFKFKSIFLSLTLFLFATTSPAENISWEVIDQGGGIRNSGDYQILDASGQGAIGKNYTAQIN